MQYHNHFSSNGIFFLLLTEKYWLPVTRWVGGNTDLPSNSNISETVRTNVVIVRPFFERLFNKLSNDTQVDRLSLVVL